jgi:uncharacterized membrane protein YbhN (UPF0104 family)
MDLNNIIENLNSFARQNTFLSILILAILGNFLTEIFKKLLYYFATKTKTVASSTGRQISKWSLKNIEFLIGHYKEEIIRVEKIKNNDKSEFFTLLETLYNNFILFFLILVLYLALQKVDNQLYFYGFLGASAKLLFQILSNTVYNHSLFEKAKNYEKYKTKKENRILQLENILNRK